MDNFDKMENTSDKFYYEMVEKAIRFINHSYNRQPNLATIAQEVNLSEFHFNRIFKVWAGVTPKKFLQYISLQHAKEILRQNHTLADAAYATGLSSTSRLHDLFVTIEAMTPGEYKNGGAALNINYTTEDSVFGKMLVASTEKGICSLFYFDDPLLAIDELKKKFPMATLHNCRTKYHDEISAFFANDFKALNKIHLHLKGTNFQLQVWEALLKIPAGKLATYARVAATINRPTACRAVGTAIGDNPVAVLIPCHRVIQSTGLIGGYRWGSIRKQALIGWESCKMYGEAAAEEEL